MSSENENPRNTKRTGLEIISDILKFCSEPRSPTEIMYQTNLSYEALKACLAKLCSLGLLSKNSMKHAATEKGCQFVMSFENIEDMLERSDSAPN
jgi:predicted transcriptional regulator